MADCSNVLHRWRATSETVAHVLTEQAPPVAWADARGSSVTGSSGEAENTSEMADVAMGYRAVEVLTAEELKVPWADTG